MGLTTQCFIQGNKECLDINTVDNVFKKIENLDSFLSYMLDDDRSALPMKYVKQKEKISNIFISRVSIGDCATAIRFNK